MTTTADQRPDVLSFTSILPEDIEWKPYAGLPDPVRLGAVVGDSRQPGSYVIRVKVPRGVKIAPHRHPEDRVYTVMSGVFYIGRGDVFDDAALTAYPPGSVVALPKETSHFHWAKSGEYITQITALGPTGVAFVNPADDSRNSA